MCYRLFASAVDAEPAALEALATEHGLDLRVRAPYVEIAWGDCACSLYTRADGRARIVAFLNALSERRIRPQLLLLEDDALETLPSTPLEKVPLGLFRERGLQALPEGQVCVVVP
ncbi:MAG: hypothetical protein ACT4TC_01400 [Myxococcaceae bacterium]